MAEKEARDTMLGLPTQEVEEDSNSVNFAQSEDGSSNDKQDGEQILEGIQE